MNWKTVLISICFSVFLSETAPAAQVDRIEALNDGMISHTGELSSAVLNDFWQQKVSPETAAQRLLYLMSFEAVPPPFFPELSVLQYQLGLYAAKAGKAWTPEFCAVAFAMQRYLALFDMLYRFPLDAASPLALLGLPADRIPATDCLPCDKAAAYPEWRATPGSVFTGPLVALPRRPLDEVVISASPLSDAQGKQALPREHVVLVALRYAFDKDAWKFKPELAGKQQLNDGMQIYLLRIKLPDDMAPGVYSGKVTLQVPASDQAVELYYRLTVPSR